MNKKKLTMEVQMTIIDNLGIKMYTTLPPVISELVANCWDAEASEVKIKIPEGPITESSEIEISDNGFGMKFDQINNAYLKIGRNKRKEEGTDETPNMKRKVMGRKGIGKLSAFGVAKEVVMETSREDKTVRFTMDIDDILATPNGSKYEPPFKEFDRRDKQPTTDVKLRKLKRTRAIDVDRVRQNLARMFSILGEEFRIIINGKEITPNERNLKRRMEHIWEIEEEIKENTGWKVSGWIGTAETPLSEELGGIVVMARGKLIQKPTFFGVTSGKEHARAYMAGELQAEFFDAEEDLMGTARNSIVWESEEGQTFLEWIHKNIVQISNEWAEKRRQKREKIIRENPEFEQWLQKLSKQEKKLANKVVRAITSDESLPEERVLNLASFMKESFNYQVFKELANQISETPTDKDTMLVSLFEEWEFLRAKEMLRLFEGNLATIEKLDEFIKTNAKEVPTIHRFFKEFPWVLDPRWTDYQDEVTYSKLLIGKFTEEDILEKDRRIDFMAIGFGDTIHVVELKRPGYRIGKEDLRQLEDYVVFVKTNLGTDPEVSYTSVSGYLICEEIQNSSEVRQRIENLKNNRMYVRKYSDLLAMAKRLHKKYIDLYDEMREKHGNKVVSGEKKGQ